MQKQTAMGIKALAFSVIQDQNSAIIYERTLMFQAKARLSVHELSHEHILPAMNSDILSINVLARLFKSSAININ